MPAPTKVLHADAARLYPCPGAASLLTTDPPPALRRPWGARQGGRLQLPAGLAWSHSSMQPGACRRNGWQRRSQEISSPLILIACDGREIYGSELRFVHGSSTWY